MAHAPGHGIFSYASSGFGGTPPFATTFDFSPDDTWGQDELDAFTEAAALTFNTTIRLKLSDGLSSGVLDTRLLTEGFVITSSYPILAGDVSAAPSLPGASFRVLKNASLPAGGRRGCMYLPGAPSTKYDGTGHVTDSFVGQSVQDWMDACTSFVDNPITFKQNHSVDGSPTTTTYSTVTQASTISFLRGRYR